MKLKQILCLFCVSVLMISVLCAPGMPVSASVGVKSNGNGGRTDVGAWFVTYNKASMWANNFGSGYPINYRTLMPDGTYGIPDSTDTEIIDFQLAQLAAAKIDFILYDLTNGGLTEKIPYGWPDNYWITETAQLTCERIKIWNESHDWKIRYAVAVGTYAAIRESGEEPMGIGQVTEYQAEAILNLFYNKYGEDNYYKLKGKPLLVIHDFGVENDVKTAGGWKMYKSSAKTDHDSGDKFIVRGSLSNPNAETGFSWLTPKEGGNIVTEESATVCPGQWNHRSGASAAPREDGQHYIRDWEKILNSAITPDIVLISSWNDFNEDTAIFTADSSNCNEKWEEKWRDDTGKINHSMYLEMTKEAIWRLRTNNGDSMSDLNSLLKDNSRQWLTDEKSDKAISKLVKAAPKSNNSSKTVINFEGNINPYVVGATLGAFVTVVLITAAVILLINLRENKKKRIISKPNNDS